MKKRKVVEKTPTPKTLTPSVKTPKTDLEEKIRKLEEENFLLRKDGLLFKSFDPDRPKTPTPTPKVGHNSKGVVIARHRDKIRTVDSYDEAYYIDRPPIKGNGNKLIVKFFFENRGKKFTEKEIAEKIGMTRFSEKTARKYFLDKKTVRAIEEGEKTFYTGVFSDELK